MPRSIWTGAISFGLVNVPVKLYSAVSKKTVRFHQLHAADGVRIQQKRMCPADGEEVPWDDIVNPDSFHETPGDDVDTTKRELDMARQLIESLTAEFDPEKFHDEYREAVLDLIERKAEGEEVVLQPVAEEPEKVPDLMAALEASLDAAKKESGGARSRRRGAEDGAGAKKQPARRGSRAQSKS